MATHKICLFGQVVSEKKMYIHSAIYMYIAPGQGQITPVVNFPKCYSSVESPMPSCHELPVPNAAWMNFRFREIFKGFYHILA